MRALSMICKRTHMPIPRGELTAPAAADPGYTENDCTQAEQLILEEVQLFCCTGAPSLKAFSRPLRSYMYTPAYTLNAHMSEWPMDFWT